MSLEFNKAAAVALIKAGPQGDLETIRSLLSDDATWWILPGTQASGEHSKQAMLDIFSQGADVAATPMQHTISDVTAEEDRVCMTARLTFKTKTGKTYDNNYAFVVFFDGDKIRHVKEYYNTAHMNDIIS